MSEHEPTLADILVAIGELRTEVMSRIDRLQAAVNAIHDDISVSFHRADRAVDAAQGNGRQLEAMSRELGAMERQIQRLQTELLALANVT
jgi:hypothetical protein